MIDMKNFNEKVKIERPKEWEQFPDIKLYMDQILGYMEKQHIGLSEDEELTSAMVNNYIKKGILPRAEGKRYGREHIAYLTMICLFKQVLSVSDTCDMLKFQLENTDIQSFYSKYCAVLDREFDKMAERLEKDTDADTIADLALELAISGYIQKLTCEKLLELLTAERKEKEPPKKK